MVVVVGKIAHFFCISSEDEFLFPIVFVQAYTEGSNIQLLSN